jgi:hypothetical protein
LIYVNLPLLKFFFAKINKFSQTLQTTDKRQPDNGKIHGKVEAQTVRFSIIMMNPFRKILGKIYNFIFFNYFSFSLNRTDLFIMTCG